MGRMQELSCVCAVCLCARAVIVRVPGPLNKTMTALNQCSATCLNQTVIEKGIAKECICPFSGKPVCANNGKTSPTVLYMSFPWTA